MLLYHIALQRILAILLLALTGFPLVGPAIASANASSLPACCRKEGKHHCTQPDRTGPSFVASSCCSSFPVAAPVTPHDSWAIGAGVSSSVAQIYSDPAGLAQTEVHYRVSESRGWQKRGPPSFTPLG